MNLKSLPQAHGAVTKGRFIELLQAPLASDFPRALQVYYSLGIAHAYSVANVLYLSHQKGCVHQALCAMEVWSGMVQQIPDPVIAYQETREFFDVVYVDLFMSKGDAINGMGFGVTEQSDGANLITLDFSW